MSHRWISYAVVCVLIGALTQVAPPSYAGDQSIMITEIYPGDSAHPSAQFIELTMYSSGQNSVAGKSLRFVDAAGGALLVTFTEDVDNGDNQASILIATIQAEYLFNRTADFDLGYPYMSPSGGKVCFTGSDDCASWGSYAGSEQGSGTPFNVPTGISDGKSMTRTTTGGDPLLLDYADDTDDSASDFVAAEPSPRDNSLGGIPGPSPQPTSSPAPDDQDAPESEMFRPEHGSRYTRQNFTSIRGVASDATSGVAQVQVALRKTMGDGSCKWWTGTRFAQTPCSKKLWVRATGTTEWTYALERLSSSVGTSVRSYTAFSRAKDKAGQIENVFERDRNAATFEIR